MAIIRFSTLTDNETITFNRLTDVLLFDDASISAGSVNFNYTGTSAISFSAQGKTIYFPSGISTSDLNNTSFITGVGRNVTFVDGSQFIFGTGAANTLVGTNSADYINGNTGADTMRGGLGGDTYVVDNAGDVVDEATAVVDGALLVSGAFDGTKGNSLSYSSSISENGRYILFSSDASNMVSGDTNVNTDVFIRDMITGTTQRVSTNDAGDEGNNASYVTFINALSVDGRYVVFSSNADNLVLDDANFSTDIFVRDMQTGTVQRATVDENGGEANGSSTNATISNDGRYVLFESDADNLVAGDTNFAKDIFLKDLQTGTLQRLSVDNLGVEANSNSFINAFAADNTFIVFESFADNLVAGDTNGYFDIFVKNLQTGILQRVSTTSSDAEAIDGDSKNAKLSADGRYMVFESTATNLVAGDTNLTSDIFVKDLLTGAIQRVSTTDTGAEVAGASSFGAISADGRYVVFQSEATDLVAGDTNGNIDIFIKDLQTGLVKRVSLGLGGAQALGDSYSPTFSADGSFITFSSDATNLEILDNNGAIDVFRVTNPFTVNPDVGVDTVISSISYTLGTNVENLTLSGTSAINGTGNDLNNKIIGNSGNNIINGGLGDDTMLGGSGNDTYTVDVTTDVVTENLNEGTDLVNVAIATAGGAYTLGNNIENATLTNTVAYTLTGNALDNVLTGNTAANTLNGGDGNDTLNGGVGNDTMLGGLGNDTYVIDVLTDVVTENLNEGTDTINVGFGTAGGTYTLAGINNIENLTLTNTVAYNLTGNALDNVLIGNTSSNTLNGGDGNDTLNGLAGSDNMIGGLGNDTYTVDSTGDVVTENLNEGADIVNVSVASAGGNYTLGANIENATLTNTVTYNLFGNALDNVLTGNVGANILDGSAGNDTMLGGLGNDTYVIDALTDVITENLNEGIDTINVGFGTAGGTYTLVTNNIENVTLTNTVAYNLTGNGLDNLLTGNAAANTLNGDGGNDTLNGGLGDDTMLGGSGNDTYTVDVTTDVVTENLNEGTDLVNVAIATAGGAYTLGNNIENATLTNTVAYTLTGNALDNVLTGNTAANTLNGGDGNDTLNGGVGNDTMLGGLGNDTYVIDVLTDVVTENLNEGTDTINVGFGTAGGTYTLAGINNIENLTLTNTVAYNLTGNALDNVLIGNTSSNTLNGGDGNDTLNGLAGSDNMIGGLGNDIYTIDTTGDIVTEAASEGIDTVNVAIASSGNYYALGVNIENATLINAGVYDLFGNDLDNVLTGNAAANRLWGGAAGSDTMIGGIGGDSYVITDSTDIVIEGLNEGVDQIEIQIETSGGTYTLTDNVENAFLYNSVAYNLIGNSENNILYGNYYDNLIIGASGNDTLNGGQLGNDTLIGGLGNDTYMISLGNIVTEGINEGTDLVQVGLGLSQIYTLGENIENAELTGTGTLIGNTLDNLLTGDYQNNVFDGGLGSDTMLGGLGNDTYTVDVTTDVITENLNEGNDLVNVAIATAGGTYTLGDNLENAALANTVAYNLTGNTLANILTGNTAANTLIGGAGKDTLNGGAGDDTMIGGAGNDTYSVDVATDVIIENVNEGKDLVNVAVATAGGTYTLSANLENATLTNTVAYNLTGNAQANFLTGNQYANVLNGGAGKDTMVGGLGDDTYTVNILTDVIIESAGIGTDLVNVAVNSAGGTYTLGDFIENATLTNTVAFNLTGNALDNVLIGNNAANILNAGNGADTLNGGGGNDTMIGGVGNDTYTIDVVTDVVIEDIDEGIDTVNVAIAAAGGTYTLGANAENATVTSSVAYNLTGNELGNALTGNALANTLIGGLGNDTLNGGLGNDIYRLKVGDGQDVIEDTDNSFFSNPESDTLKFDDVTSTNLTSVVRDTYNLIINYGQSDSVVIKNHFLSENYQISQFQFSDDVTLTAQQLYAMYSVKALSSPNNVTTQNNDFIIGTATSETIFGSGGIDRLYGDAGNDTLDGGVGADSMQGGLGDDIYYVDSADDVVIETLLTNQNQLISDGNNSFPYLTAQIEATGSIVSSGDGRYMLIGTGYNNNTGLYGGVTLKDTVTGSTSIATGVVPNAAVGSFNISSDGKFMVFSTSATNLLPDHQNVNNVYYRNLVTGELKLVSPWQSEYPTGAYGGSISSDGRYVTFQATIAPVFQGKQGLYIVDMQTGVRTRVNTAVDGLQESGGSDGLTISEDGRYAVFTSSSDNLSGSNNLAVNDLNGVTDVYFKDMKTGVLQLVSITAGGLQSNGTNTGGISMSADGRYIAFVSDASNLVAGDTNGQVDVFVKDMKTGAITLASTTENGTQGNGEFSYFFTKMSPDGRFVAFNSTSTNFGQVGDGGWYIKDLLTGKLSFISGEPVAQFSIDSWAVTFVNDGQYFDGTNWLLSTPGIYKTENSLMLGSASSVGGVDTVISSVSYTLSDGVENLTLAGSDTLDATGNISNNILTGNSADNVLSGGLGNDTLIGGEGADVYMYTLGDGHDQINNFAADDLISIDTLRIMGITPGEVTLGRVGDDLVISTSLLNDSVTVKNYYVGADNKIDQIEFDDETIWDQAFIELNDDGPTNGNDNITGTIEDDYIDALEGDDYVYGDLGNDEIIGGGGNDTLNGGAGNDTMVGGLGNDTYTIDVTTDVVTEAASAGTDLVNVAITTAGGTYTVAANVENATLTNTVAYNLTGNTLNNILVGNTASNSLNGGSGNDTMIGGLGNDTYTINVTTDVITENLNEGTDLVNVAVTTAGGTYTLAANVENATLTNTVAYSLTGNVLDNVLTGNAAANTLNGGDGNDTLNGLAGNDTMVGGLGNDTYTINVTTDVITENLNEGTDLVNVAVTTAGGTYTLAANVENATLTNTVAYSLTGNVLDNVLTGNAAANTLNGGDGNDTLNGLAGNDTMVGGLGNDTYTIDVTTDVTTEAASAGTDLVNVAVATAGGTYTVAANVENAILINTVAYNLTGNASNNVLTGNAAANALNGGTGNDTMIGGAGNDTYTIDVTTDVITESLNEGTDLVNVAVTTAGGTYTLAANVENATLTNTVAYSLTGNVLDNVLTGNAAANTLNGGDGNDTLNGLAGNDTMVGGLGNDTYTIDVTTDVTTEAASAGTDLVNVAVTTAGGTYTLAANVENATLTNTVAYSLTGNALDNVLIGNAAANTLTGNDGNDTLDGLAGNDTMIGGLGNDTYTIGATGDVVTEAANAGTDTVNVTITTASGTYTVAANLENAILTNTVAYNLTGNALANFLKGNAANNTFTDTAGGNDILQGLAGVDTFNDTVGNNLFDGGIGNDSMTGGSGRDIFVGGTGNDTITTGTGFDVISFNKGDGADIVNASTGADNTLSLGGNFAYSDLSLTKTGNDLILKMGATDQITVKDWYLSSPTNKSVINLQVIAEAMQGFSLGSVDVLRNNKVENFNFADIVSQFDAEGATANWQFTDARLTAHLQAGSDTAAIGGDLAYQYGMNSNLTGMGLGNAQSVIAAANFGQTAQTLNNPSVWQAEVVKLG